MEKNNELEIHKDNEIWQYEGQVVFTQELVNFFENERKFEARQRKSDARNIAFENLDLDKVQSQIRRRTLDVDEQVEVKILLEKTYELLKMLTDVEQRRFKLNRLNGLTVSEIAVLENVSVYAVSKSIINAKEKLKKARNSEM